MSWLGERITANLRNAVYSHVLRQSPQFFETTPTGEVLNAIPIVQSYTAEDREAQRFSDSTEQAFGTAVKRSRARAGLVAFIIISTAALLLWGLYQGTQAVIAGEITAGHLGQTVVYIIILAGAVAVLGEVYGDLLRAAGASERLMELLSLELSLIHI